MRLLTRHPHVRQVDNYPAANSDIHGRHTIRWPSEATGLATKAVTGPPVSLAHVAAGRTRLGRVGRIDEDDGDPGRLGFVGQEGTELVKGPSAEALALLPRDDTHQATGDAVQRFQRNSPLS